MNVVCVGYESANWRNKFLKVKVIHFYHKFKLKVHEAINILHYHLPSIHCHVT